MTLYNLVIPGTTGHLNTLVSVSAGVVNSKAEPIYSFETLFVIETANFSVGMICVCSSDNCRLIQTLPGRHGVRVVVLTPNQVHFQVEKFWFTGTSFL